MFPPNGSSVCVKDECSEGKCVHQDGKDVLQFEVSRQMFLKDILLRFAHIFDLDIHVLQI